MKKIIIFMLYISYGIFNNISAYEITTTAGASIESSKKGKKNSNTISLFADFSSQNSDGKKLINNKPESTQIAGTKATCDGVEFNLDPTAFLKSIISKILAESTNFLNKTEVTPDNVINAFIDTIIGTLCLLQNPEEVIEQMQKGMACLGKIDIGSISGGGDVGLATGYVYPVPTMAADMKINMDLTSFQNSASCFNDIIQKQTECKNGSDSPECTFMTCFYNAKKEFFSILNTKIRGAAKANNSTEKLRERKCEYIKKKNNKIMDTLSMNPRDKKSFISNFRNTLAQSGINMSMDTDAVDYTQEEQEEMKKYNLSLTPKDPKIIEKEKKIEKLKEKVCGKPEKQKEGVLPKIKTINLNNFNLNDSNIMEKMIQTINLKTMNYSSISNRIISNNLFHLKMELYRYIFALRKDNDYTFIENPILIKQIKYMNRYPLISLSNSNFLNLPDLNKTRLSDRNQMIFANDFCNIIRRTPSKIKSYKKFLYDLNAEVSKNSYKLCTNGFCSSKEEQDEFYENKYPLNYFYRTDEISDEISGFILNYICPRVDNTYKKMLKMDKVKKLKSINNSMIKQFITKKLLDKENAKKQKDSEKGDRELLNGKNPYANNLKELLESWTNAREKLENNKIKINLWEINN